MHLSYILVVCGIVLQGLILPSAGEAQIIDQSEFEELIYYWKYAVSAYQNSCPKPNGRELIDTINSNYSIPNGLVPKTGDTQGFIARDDVKKAIIVAFRGTDSTFDMAVTNLAGVVATPYNISGKNKETNQSFTTNFGTNSVKVHGGFLIAYNVVSQFVFDDVQTQLKNTSNAGYSVVVVGHSLGGALASISAMTLQSNLPSGTKINLYTFGQPRTGNVPYVNWVNGRMTSNPDKFNSIRVTHQGDIVTVIPARVGGTGYVHHGREYFQNNQSATASNVNKCKLQNNDFEDPDCQAKLRGINTVAPHSNYLGINTSQSFCT